MIWLTLRQHRGPIIGMLVTVALLAIGLALMGAYAAAERVALGVDTCVPLPNTNANCVDLMQEWRRRLGLAPFLVAGLALAPALAASFIGGPLFGAELELGAHRLTLTQAISRVRWAATKLGVALAITFACSLVLAQLGWAVPALNGMPAASLNAFDVFDVEGPPVVGYALFGVAVGSLLGVSFRRALTGMFLGLLVFTAVRALVAGELRPNYEPPLVAYQNAMSSGRTDALPKAWVFSIATVDARGRPIDFREIDRLMRGFGPSMQAGGPRDMGEYLATLGVRERVVYQPAERYPKFQWIEFGLFTGLAAECALVTIVLLRRRDA
jgi:hypothetical protein